MDPDDAALLAFERESAAHFSGGGGGGGGGGDDDDFHAQMEAEMAREEAHYQKLLRDPARMAALTDIDADGDGDGDGGGEHAINDEDVLGELAELEGEVHAEGGGAIDPPAKRPRGPGQAGADHAAEISAGSQGEMDEDAMLAEAEAEADRIAAEEEAAARKPAPTAKPAANAAVVPPRPPRTQQQELTSASAASVTPAPSASAVAAAELAALQAQLLDLKAKAVAFKQAGNQAQAIEVLRNYKTVQARIQDLQSKNAAAPTAAAAAPAAAARPTPPAAAAAKPSVPSRPAAAAVAAAKPAPAVAASVAASSSAAAPSASFSSGGKLSMRATLEYDDLLSKLDSQIASLSASMKTLVAEGAGVAVTPGSKQAKLMALQYFRAKTRSTKDRDLVALARSRNLPPPQTHYEDLSIQRELSFPELGEDELQLTVLAAHDLHNKAATSDPKDLSCFVTAFLEYAADLEGTMKTAAGVSSSTAKTKGASPSWGSPAAAAASGSGAAATGGWVSTLPFPYPRVAAGSSKDRSGLKKLMRSRVVFVVYHKRFLLGSLEVGRADIRLKDFALKAEIKQSLKLKDGQTRTGELDVIVRLRRPFEGIDLRSSLLHLLIVDEFEVEAAAAAEQQQQVAAQVAQAAKNAAATSQQLSRPIESMGATHPTAASVSVAASAAAPAAAAASAASSSAAAATPGVSAAELANPHEIVRMRSNDVLEAEVALVTAQIAALSKSAPAAGSEQAAEELEALQDRLTAAQIQLQVLVTQVQNGKLSLAEYLEGLRKAIVSESQLAIALNKQNRKADALRVLQRVKLMKTEVTNAEENQDELEQC